MWRIERGVLNFNQKICREETIRNSNSVDGRILLQWILNKLGMIGELELVAIRQGPGVEKKSMQFQLIGTQSEDSVPYNRFVKLFLGCCMQVVVVRPKVSEACFFPIIRVYEPRNYTLSHALPLPSLPPLSLFLYLSISLISDYYWFSN